MTIRLYNLLFERKTNEAVQGFVRFFIDHVLKELTEPKYSKDKNRISDSRAVGYPYFVLSVKSSYNPSYEEYKKINPDDNNLIIRNQTDLEDFINQIDIQVFPKNKEHSNVWGSMSSDGVISIYNQEWTDINKTPSTEQIKNYIEEVTPSVVIHEIGHYINAFRSSHRTGRAVNRRFKTRGKDPESFYDVSTKEYAESTEEIQARMTEFVSYLEDLLKTPVDKVKDLYKDEENRTGYWLLHALAKKDFERFYDAGFNTPSFHSMRDIYVKGTMSPKIFKRVVGDRFWKIFEEYKNKDLPIYGAVLSYLKPPPR